MIDLTHEEERVIASLHRVAKKWPESLWLFSAGGGLYVMKKTEDGKRAVLGNPEFNYRGNPVDQPVDQEYVVGTIDIENDGGDW